MTDPALEVRGLRAGYPGVLALEDVGLRVEPGSLCALLGANGSGKSTLFSALLGLRRPFAGSVSIFGRSPAKARRGNLVSYLPQLDAVDHSFPVTVGQVVMMGRNPHQGITRRVRPEDRRVVDAALEQVDLLDLRHRTVGELSGGQRRRAMLARSIAQQTPLMLLDEPFAGVDRASEELIVSVLHALRDSGTSLLVSTHHLDGVEALADEVVLLHRRVLAAGRPSEVLTEEQLARAFGAVLASDPEPAPHVDPQNVDAEHVGPEIDGAPHPSTERDRG